MINKDPEKTTKYRKIFYILFACIALVVVLIFTFYEIKQQPKIKALHAGLHVSGNQLLNAQGQQVILHGVNRSGTEYQCVKGNNKIFEGPHDEASVQAMKLWHINAVRIPLNEDCWLGINGAYPSGPTYQQVIKQYVKLLNQNDIYVILELHWSAPGDMLATGQKVMADKDHSLAFWTSVADMFKENHNIMFDLYNEPRGISWSCWKDGSDCHAHFQIASMQDMINTVRATGATNVLLLGGLNYANDLSGWLSNEPTDPLNNLVASWHIYGKNACDKQSCWDKQVAPVIAQVPVIAGEFGESVDGKVCDNNTTLSNAFLNWMDQHNASYLAWTWDAWSLKCSDLSLITDYNGTPKFPNGTNYKNHLAQF